MLKKSLLAALIITSTSTIYAAPNECPEKLNVTETVAAIDDWTTNETGSVKILSGWSIYEGNLGDTQYQQAPAESVEKDNKLTQVWDFDGKHNYWIQCKYAETSMTLMKKIPTTTKQCRVTFKLDKHHNTIEQESMSC